MLSYLIGDQILQSAKNYGPSHAQYKFIYSDKPYLAPICVFKLKPRTSNLYFKLYILKL